jgi:E3 ubiquitin-protein ligase MARCH6
MLLSLPLDLLSTENLAVDVFRGCFVVTCTLFAFIGLVWLREQILHGGPDWLERDGEEVNNEEVPAAAPQAENNNNNNNNNQEAEDNDVENNNQEEFNNNNNNNLANANLLAEQQNQQAPQQNPENLEENEVPIPAPPEIPVQPNNRDEIPIDAPINPAEPPVMDQDDQEPAVEAAEAANEEGIWNPMEFNNGAELELTWERLLGLDGSMVFLEHVFWVVSLNTLFIFIFAFLPYTIGNMVIANLLGIKPIIHFHGLLTTLCGYCIVGVALVCLHAIARILKLKKPRRIFGLCYIVVKVSFLFCFVWTLGSV